MKYQKIFYSSVTLITCLLSPITQANASPSGCPDSWTIPKNLIEASNEQIQELYARDFNTIITPNRDMQFSFDGTSWTNIKNGAINIRNVTGQKQKEFEASVLLNFFKSRWEDVTLLRLGDLSWTKQNKIYLRTSVSVLKQGCGPATTYFSQSEFSPPSFENLLFENEIAKIKDKFQNFRAYDEALSIYKNCLLRWQNYNNSNGVKKPLFPCYMWTPGGPEGIYVDLIPEEPKCLEFIVGDANNASTIGVKNGSDCTYQIMGFTGESFLNNVYRSYPSPPYHYNPITEKLVTFGSLRINTKNKLTKVTCIKGKTSKTISGLNPKCPSGYKKKSS
jgi:hypothetical protein